MASLTRGSLPASVYWRRRAAVLGVLLLLFIGLTRMFGGSDDSDAAARNTSATAKTHAPVVPDNVGAPAASPGATPSTPVAAPTSAAIAPDPTAPATTLPQPSAALPTPTGRCSDDDVNVAVRVGTAEATKRVYFALSVKTNVQAACLWQIGPKAVQVQVTSGSDRIWSTIDCPKAVPSQLLTLRRDTPVEVAVKWNSRRSDDACSDHTTYAQLGYYHVQVAALGGEPTDVQFRLTKPTPAAPKPSSAATATAPAATAPSNPTSSVTATLGPGGNPIAPANPKKKGARSEPTGEPVHPD